MAWLGAPPMTTYAITIEATCTFRVRFSNMVRFSGGLGNAIGQLEANQTKLPNYAVKAGELIGDTGLPTAYGIDIWVEDDDITLTGFVNPAQYTAAEVWKTHVADLFDSAQEPLKSQLLALDERDATPRWGKIDYDIDGKLVGNWFRVGSGGYAGVNTMNEGYWDAHLAVVYDGNDPGQIDISFGNYQGARGSSRWSAIRPIQPPWPDQPVWSDMSWVSFRITQPPPGSCGTVRPISLTFALERRLA